MRLATAAISLALTVILTLSAQGAVITDLQGYWNFNDNTQDQTAANRHGSLQGNAGYIATTPIGVGKSLNLDGAGDHVLINGWKGVTGTAARTSAAWIQTTSAAPNDDMGIISWGTGSNGQRWGMWVDDTVPTYPLRLVVHGGTVRGGPDLSDQSWHHVAVGVTDGATANDAQIWVDGILQTLDNSSTRAINTASGNDVRIGRAIGGGEADFNGQIDEAAVWSALKTNQEMALVHGVGRYSGVALNDSSIDSVLDAFNSQGATIAGSELWSYKTAADLGNPSTTVGFSGGTAGADAYIVLDASGNGMQTVASTPRAQWALDESAGTTAVDSSGNNYDGTINGATINQTGKIGGAYDFSGNNANVDIPASAHSEFVSDSTGTLAGWFNTSSTDREAIFAFGDANENDRTVIELDASGEFRVIVRDNGINMVERRTTDTYNDGQWHHFAVVQDATGDDGPDMYLDGVKVTNFTLNNMGDQWFDDVGNLDSMKLGFDLRASSPPDYDGLLDDFAYWDDPLTAGQAIALYNLGDEESLNYDASEVQSLFDEHLLGDLGMGVLIDDLTWTFTEGLTGNPGDLTGAGSFFTLQLNATTGLTTGSAQVPEPSTFALAALGLIGLGWFGRRRRTQV